MKYMQRFFVAIFLLCIFVSGGIEVAAMNTGFSTEFLSEKDQNTFLSNLNITMSRNEPAKRAIVCFDVNENGMIAIGHEVHNDKIICIYSHDGIFQYCYKFSCSGSFGIEWDENNINIYFIRSDVIAAVNSTGEIVNVLKVQNTIENNSYRNHFINGIKRTVGDTEYTLRNDMGIFNVFASSYSQLVMTKTTGESNILYNVNSTQFANIVLICVGVLIVVSFAMFMIIQEFIKLKHNM